MTRVAGASLNINNSGGGSITTTGLANDATSGGGIIGPWATFGSGAATRWANLTGSTFSAYTGGAAVTAANSLTSATTNYDLTLGATSTTTANTTANTVRFTGATGRQITIGGTSTAFTLTLNGLMNAGTAGLTIANGAANTGGVLIGASKELALDAANSDISITAPIGESVAGSTVVIGPGTGTVTLSGNNTFTGGITLNPGGTLGTPAGTVAALGTGTLTINGGTIFRSTGSTFTNANANNITVNADFAIGGSSAINLGGGTATLNKSVTIAVNNSGLTLGTIVDGGNVYGITKSGVGSLTLGQTSVASNNSFMGPLTILGGTVSIAAGNHYALNQSNEIRIAPGAFFANNQITLYVAGISDANGGGGTVTLYARPIIVTGSGDYSFSGSIVNGNAPGTFNMSGSGSETLSGTNTATAGVVVSSGKLILDFSTATSPTFDIIDHGTFTGSQILAGFSMGGGTLDINGKAATAISQTFGTFNVNSGGSAVAFSDHGTSEVLNLGSIIRGAGGTLDFTLPSAGGATATNGVRSTVLNAGATGIIGGYATVGGADWAVSSATVTTNITTNGTANGGVYTFTMPGAGAAPANNSTVSINVLPAGSGITAGQLYFVVNSSGSNFQLATTVGGTPLTNTNATISSTNNTAASLNLQGNINAAQSSDYTAFNDTATTNTKNYLLTGSANATNSQTTNTLKIAPAAPGGALAIAAGKTLSLSGNGILFTGSQDYAINGGTISGGETIFQQYSDHTLTVNSVVGGSSLTKSGPGTLVLNGLNTFTGNVTLNSGITEFNSFATGAPSASGAGAASTTAAPGATIAFNGGTLRYASNFSADITTRLITINAGGAVIDTNGNDVTFANVFGQGNSTSGTTRTGAGGFTKTGAGKLTIGGIAAYLGPTVIKGGILSIGGATPINQSSINGTAASGSLTITLPSGTTAGLQVGQVLYNASGGLLAGTVIVSIPTSTTLTISNGSNSMTNAPIVVEAFNALGNAGFATSSSLGMSTYAPENLILDSGTLQYTGPATSTNRLFIVTENSGAIDASGGGAVVFSSPGALAFTPKTTGGNHVRTLTLTGSNSNDNTITPIISDAAASSDITAVTKSGAGTWALNGANTYTGATTIQSGTLKLNGSVNNIVNSSRIIVGDTGPATLDVTGITSGFVLGPTQTLAGHGTVAGNVATVNGSTLTPGNSIGTTSYTANLTIGAGTSLDYDFAGSSSADNSQVALLLTLPTATGSITLNMTDAGSLAAGTFKIFGYGTLAGGAPTLDDTFVINPPGTPSLAGDTYNVVNNSTNHEIDLVITGTAVPEPMSLGLLGVGAAGLLLRRRRRS